MDSYILFFFFIFSLFLFFLFALSWLLLISQMSIQKNWKQRSINNTLVIKLNENRWQHILYWKRPHFMGSMACLVDLSTYYIILFSAHMTQLGGLAYLNQVDFPLKMSHRPEDSKERIDDIYWKRYPLDKPDSSGHTTHTDKRIT